jgi:hypothetical protein
VVLPVKDLANIVFVFSPFDEWSLKGMKEGGGLGSLTFPEFIVLSDFDSEPRDNALFFLGSI